jgi:hypothetical protein
MLSRSSFCTGDLQTPLMRLLSITSSAERAAVAVPKPPAGTFVGRLGSIAFEWHATDRRRDESNLSASHWRLRQEFKMVLPFLSEAVVNYMRGRPGENTRSVFFLDDN